MQQSWRKDTDKLTFIACLPPQPSTSTITPQHHDSPDRMIGDINLFLVPYDSSEDEDEDAGHNDTGSNTNAVIGELEIMIAAPAHRGKGYGKAALLAFMQYISSHLAEILREYTGSGEAELKYLRVKIGMENRKSVKLFEGVGFVGDGEGPNYFGEVELRLGDLGGLKGREGFVVPEVLEYRLEA